MTSMLARISSTAEAEAALEAGADGVECAVGADIAEIARAVGGRCAVTALAHPAYGSPADQISALGAAGAAKVRLILSEKDCAGDLRALALYSGPVRLAAALAPQQGDDRDLTALAARCGVTDLMIDTGGAGRLLDHCGPVALSDFTESCRAHGLACAFAGALEAPDMPRLLLLAPDALAIDFSMSGPAAFAQMRALIPSEKTRLTAPAAGKRVDFSLMSERGFGVDLDEGDAPTDCIFVRGLTVPMRIGAYASEQTRLQNVRFTVEADIIRAAHAGDDMRDVFSYDIITDGITLLAGREVFAMVETVAERVAGLILRHRRVAAVRVKVEKLEVGPAGVGIVIERRRAAETADIRQLFPGLRGAGKPKG